MLLKLPLLRHAIFAIRSPDPAAANSASGSKNHRTALYCRQADSAAAGFSVSADLKFSSTRCSRSAAVDGSQSGLMEPNWFHWDRPPAQEWPQRCPDGTTEFQLFRHILSYQMSRWQKMSIVPVKWLRQKQLRRISNPPQLSCVLTVVCRNLSG